MSSIPRLYAILARRRPVAIVFRRGPSKQVLLIKWNTAKHEIQIGQWLKGRIYERRCDLSPSGERLIYFAAKYKEPNYSWTAISRPPFLTALAMWNKGDGWGGGGLFTAENSVALNHRAGEDVLADGYSLPKKFLVTPFGNHSGRGEDDPIWSARMIRDGWTLKSPGEIKKNKFGSKLEYEFVENQVLTKRWGRWSLEMRMIGMIERNGPWYVLEHRIVDAAGIAVADLGRSDWADWSLSGEILLARLGKLYRVAVDHKKKGPSDPIEVADLRAMHFEAIESPPAARSWTEG
jgi:hypothetical protein